MWLRIVVQNDVKEIVILGTTQPVLTSQMKKLKVLKGKVYWKCEVCPLPPPSSAHVSTVLGEIKNQDHQYIVHVKISTDQDFLNDLLYYKRIMITSKLLCNIWQKWLMIY